MPTPVNRSAAMPDTLERHFRHEVLCNRHNRAILDCRERLALPDGWLVAGCLFQTIWNLQAGLPAEANIKDYDLFYFDPTDLSEAAERRMQAHVEAELGELGIVIEVSNQARVHLWYAQYFGKPCPVLQSACDGIDRFLIPATCVGITPERFYAPNGLQALYDGVLEMNPLTPHQALFESKAASYQARWPRLSIRY